MYYTLNCAYFQLSESELVEPHIIPLKVRLAVALKEEAKCQVSICERL